jgi:hypothetical protein
MQPVMVFFFFGGGNSGLLLLLFFVLPLIIGGLVSMAGARRAQALQSAPDPQALESVRRTADEDVTRYGEDLQRLDIDVTGQPLDDAARQDYQRALDCYEAAKEGVAAIRTPDEIRHVASTLEDGRYAIACVKARLAGEPLPVRRPPCFFNPQHGPSAEDVSWAPPGGVRRDVPACPADAERVRAGAEPDVRTVQVGPQRMPYWQAGPAYSPWVQGYFGAYAMSGLLPAFMIGSLMGGAFTGWGSDFDSGGGGGDGGGGDYGGDGGGGEYGGDGGGGDYAGGDFSGGDFGGGDFGGGDFGGGDFGGF